MQGSTGTGVVNGSSNNVIILSLVHGDKIWITVDGKTDSGYTLFTGFRLF